MRITNRLGLPEPLVRAVTPLPREEKPSRVSVTTLTQPAQIYGLTKLHSDELTEDASGRLWALMGQLLHSVLEQQAEGLENTITEEKLEMKVLGWTVVGKYDLSEIIVEGELLTDWKFTSVYSLKDGMKPDWERQINIYVALLKYHGRQITKAQVVAIGRDWSQLKAKREQGYPQEQVKIMPVPLWEPEKTQAYIEGKVQLFQDAEKGIWPECTDEERWARPKVFALMKKGQKKAVKLFETLHAAEWAVARDQYIVERPGENIRCNSYCGVSQWCEQKRKLDAAQEVAKTQNN